MSAIHIDRLSPAERLELIGELWDSLDPADVPLTEAQAEELERRLSAGAQEGKTWSELEAELRKR
jgi:putative addiction module component (TIGR02574 family)